MGPNGVTFVQFICMCTMEPCDILKVKNTLVKCVYNITEYSVCNLILSWNEM